MKVLRYFLSSWLLCAVMAFAQNTTVQKPTPELQMEIEQAIIGINALRAEKGLTPLQPNPHLMAYAQRRAEELVQKFSHTRPNGQKPSAAVQNFMTFAENIAAGQGSGEATVIQWKNSKGHYHNMMGRFDTLGLGVVYAPHTQYRYYWALVLADKNATTVYVFE